MSEIKFSQIRQDLDSVSPSFCLAKWLQVTVHLQNGYTHSCQHPQVHKIPLEEIAASPSAIHNTLHKKAQRKMMLEGKRPPECDYCWKVEDANPDNFSDRMVKSSDSWAHPLLRDVAKASADADINPTYFEVSWGHECNFKCAYCSPVISSSLLSELHKFGPYSMSPMINVEELKRSNQYPISKDEHNPYVDAFWKWWPEFSPQLKVFRITGGEPLINPNTFRFLEDLIKNPRPELVVAINSNLGIPDTYLERFLTLASEIVEKKLVKELQFYTSIDSWGPQAEYIRFGLDCDKFLKNCHLVLTRLPDCKFIMMCTYSILSVTGFTQFLKIVYDLKQQYPLLPDGYVSRVELSISYLRHPYYLSPGLIPKSFLRFMEESLEFMLRPEQEGKSMLPFTSFETGQMRRILDVVKNVPEDDPDHSWRRKHFYRFMAEYDHRKETSFVKTFPDFEEVYLEWEKEISAD